MDVKNYTEDEMRAAINERDPRDAFLITMMALQRVAIAGERTAHAFERIATVLEDDAGESHDGRETNQRPVRTTGDSPETA